MSEDSDSIKCRICGLDKPSSRFCERREGVCKLCMNARARQYYRDNKRALDLLSDAVDSDGLNDDSWYAIHHDRLVRDLRVFRKLMQGKGG